MICYHCKKPFASPKGEIAITIGNSYIYEDSDQPSGDCKLYYKPLQFHLACFVETAGMDYVPKKRPQDEMDRLAAENMSAIIKKNMSHHTDLKAYIDARLAKRDADHGGEPKKLSERFVEALKHNEKLHWGAFMVGVGALMLGAHHGSLWLAEWIFIS